MVVFRLLAFAWRDLLMHLDALVQSPLFAVLLASTHLWNGRDVAHLHHNASISSLPELAKAMCETTASADHQGGERSLMHMIDRHREDMRVLPAVSLIVCCRDE